MVFEPEFDAEPVLLAMVCVDEPLAEPEVPELPLVPEDAPELLAVV
jgi:hypothetical protein